MNFQRFSGDGTPSQPRKHLRSEIRCDAQTSIVPEIHYHIRWADLSLDWKPFPTKEEAAEVAEHIKKPNENYTIVGRDDECERCKMFKAQAFE